MLILPFFFLLHFAKIKKNFVHLFSNRYIDRRDFEYVEMDTDNAYMALSAPLESIIKPSEKMNFYHNYGQWIPRPYCETHRTDFLAHKMQAKGEWHREECCSKVYAFDQRTPALFKDEFVGSGIIALNSKTFSVGVKVIIVNIVVWD